MAGCGYAAAETREAFEHARALAEKIGDARSLFHADYGLWAASQVHGDLPDAEARGRRALAACNPDDPADVRTVAQLMVGMSLVSMGRFAEGASHLQESVALYDPERHADHPQRFSSHTRATSLTQLAIARWCQGDVDAALADMETSLAVSRHVESGLARRQVLGHVGALKTIIDPAGAGEVIEELFKSSLRDGAPLWQARARALRVGVLTAQGDPCGALDDAALGRDVLDRSGALNGQPLYLGLAAKAQIALGRFDDAAASLRDIDVMIEAGQRWTESNVRCIEGDLMLARGDVAAAEACWRRAIAIARAQGAASWELRAATRLARFLADRGAPSDAATLLAPVLVQIDGGRATPTPIAAAALLRELERLERAQKAVRRSPASLIRRFEFPT